MVVAAAQVQMGQIVALLALDCPLPQSAAVMAVDPAQSVVQAVVGARLGLVMVVVRERQVKVMRVELT